MNRPSLVVSTSRSSTSLLAGLVCLLATIGLMAPAAAHGELEAADPAPNSTLDKAPPRVTLALTEQPSGDSVIRVTDGCKLDVVTGSSVEGNDLVARVSNGQPGKWEVSFRVISAEDGHLTKGTYNFTVKGQKDCSPDDGGDDPSSSPPPEGGNGGPTSSGDGGSDFPVVPVLVGAVVIVLVGVVIRRFSAR